MERREKGRKWSWLLLFVVAVAAVLTGYFFGLKRGLEERVALVKSEIPSASQKTDGVQLPPEGEKKTYTIKRAEPVKSPERPETCSQIDETVVAFFKNLDQKR